MPDALHETNEADDIHCLTLGPDHAETLISRVASLLSVDPASETYALIVNAVDRFQRSTSIDTVQTTVGLIVEASLPTSLDVEKQALNSLYRAVFQLFVYHETRVKGAVSSVHPDSVLRDIGVLVMLLTELHGLKMSKLLREWQDAPTRSIPLFY